MKKTKFHIEHSKRAMEVLKKTDYSKCTLESMAAQLRRFEKREFEQLYPFLKELGITLDK